MRSNDWNPNYLFTLLLGPSNSGKTSWFLNFASEHTNELNCIITTVDKKNICPLDKTLKQFDKDCYFVNLNSITNNISSSNINSTDEIKSKCNVNNINIFVDEIHLFSPSNLSQLTLLIEQLQPQNLFISMLPGSYTQDPLPNTFNLVAKAHNIIVMTSVCCECKCPTTHSRRINNPATEEEEAAGKQIIIGKKLFVTMCKNCFLKK